MAQFRPRYHYNVPKSYAPALYGRSGGVAELVDKAPLLRADDAHMLSRSNMA